MLSRHIFLPVLLSLCSPSTQAFTPARLGRVIPISTQLYDAASVSEVASMRAGEIKAELESYGISTVSFLEKSELVDALEKARSEGLKPKKDKKKKKKRREDDTAASSTTTESSSSESSDGRPREERLAEELENCRQMKAGELKKELEERGVSTRSFFEKSEFVKALADARVDGVEKKNEESYAEYANVEVLTDDNSGPRTKQSAQSQQPQGGSPFGGANPFGGAGMGDMGGMGGMGGIADMLKNMGGGAGPAGANPFGGAAGANPFGGMGGMGGMGDAMGKAQELMKNPKVMEIMAKAQSNPKIAKAMQECMSNPAAFAKYQNDPEVGELMRELQKYM